MSPDLDAVGTSQRRTAARSPVPHSPAAAALERSRQLPTRERACLSESGARPASAARAVSTRPRLMYPWVHFISPWPHSTSAASWVTKRCCSCRTAAGRARGLLVDPRARGAGLVGRPTGRAQA
jgi:hypothetical protein